MQYMPLTMPDRHGYYVTWETGKTIHMRNGRTRQETKSFESTSREAVEQKRAELERQGFKIIALDECIF